MSNPATSDEPAPDGFADLSDEELEQLDREGDEAEAALRRGECVPMDEVLPRLRKAG